MNDWLIDEWLTDKRLKASIVIPYENVEASVKEIERRAGDKRFVQVLLMSRTAEPLGQRKYWPIFEAAERPGCRSACTPSATAASRSRAAAGRPITPRR